MLQHLLLESPAPLLIALLAVAVGFFVMGNRLKRTALFLASLVMLLLTLAIALVAWRIQTPREQAQTATRQLLQATCPLDLNAMRKMVAPSAEVTNPAGEMIVPANRLIDVLDRTVKAYPISTQTILEMQSSYLHADDQEHSPVTVQLTLRTGLGTSGAPTTTRWQLTWTPPASAATAWQLEKIQWTSIMDRSPTASLLP